MAPVRFNHFNVQIHILECLADPNSGRTRPPIGTKSGFCETRTLITTGIHDLRNQRSVLHVLHTRSKKRAGLQVRLPEVLRGLSSQVRRFLREEGCRSGQAAQIRGLLEPIIQERRRGR
jgi:hypothetical protein